MISSHSRWRARTVSYSPVSRAISSLAVASRRRCSAESASRSTTVASLSRRSRARLAGRQQPQDSFRLGGQRADVIGVERRGRQSRPFEGRHRDPLDIGHRLAEVTQVGFDRPPLVGPDGGIAAHGEGQVDQQRVKQPYGETPGEDGGFALEQERLVASVGHRHCGERHHRQPSVGLHR
jgi:hypothetical protein